LASNRPDGTLDPAGLAAAFPEDPEDPQFAPAALRCLENTQNRSGGVVPPDGYQRDVARLTAARGVAVHLNGARAGSRCTSTVRGSSTHTWPGSGTVGRRPWRRKSG